MSQVGLSLFGGLTARSCVSDLGSLLTTVVLFVEAGLLPRSSCAQKEDVEVRDYHVLFALWKWMSRIKNPMSP
jgi:hypothetical protein